jgi:AcrR family transcriptional regulator
MGSHAADSSHGALSEKRSRTVHSILGAAMQIVMEEGVAGLSMSALAQRAGMSRQTIYNYFPDVEAVLTGLVEMGDAGDTELARRMEGEDDPRAALCVFVDAVVASAASGHPSAVALAPALPATLRNAIAAHQRHTERLVVDVLRRGQEEGRFRADLDPELDGRLFCRAALAAAELAVEPDVEAARLAEHLGADLLRMVVAEGSTPANC